MNDREKVFTRLRELEIPFDCFEHPPIPTIEDAIKYWKDIDSRHCKNLFFRNHKGNRHYLVILESMKQFGIHDLEKRLKQGKLSFASPARMAKYLEVLPGSVSIFGIINDKEKHVHIFLDNDLKKSERLSFHPNDNTATIVISFKDFMKFLNAGGNSYEWLVVSG
jgi:Ala-tRNA(Pro) deacylase